MPFVTSSVLAYGSLSTTSMKPSRPTWSPVTTASPISGWLFSTTVATSPKVRAPFVVSSIGMFARSAGAMIGRLCWMPMRWLGVSMKPPVPGDDASRKVSGETHSALPAELTTCSSETPFSFSLAGSTCTWS